MNESEVSAAAIDLDRLPHLLGARVVRDRPGVNRDGADVERERERAAAAFAVRSWDWFTDGSPKPAARVVTVAVPGPEVIAPPSCSVSFASGVVPFEASSWCTMLSLSDPWNRRT